MNILWTDHGAPSTNQGTLCSRRVKYCGAHEVRPCPYNEGIVKLAAKETLLLTFLTVAGAVFSSPAVFADNTDEVRPWLLVKFNQTGVSPTSTAKECSLDLKSTSLSGEEHIYLLSLLKTAGFSFAHSRRRYLPNGMWEEAHPQGSVYKQFKANLPPDASAYTIEVEVNDYKVFQTATFDDACRAAKILKLRDYLQKKCLEQDRNLRTNRGSTDETNLKSNAKPQESQ